MNVTLRKSNGQVQILNLSDQFSLNKSSIYNKNLKGSDTMQQRLADIEHDVNGVQPQYNKLENLVSKVSAFRNTKVSPELIDAMQGKHQHA